MVANELDRDIKPIDPGKLPAQLLAFRTIMWGNRAIDNPSREDADQLFDDRFAGHGFTAAVARDDDLRIILTSCLATMPVAEELIGHRRNHTIRDTDS